MPGLRPAANSRHRVQQRLGTQMPRLHACAHDLARVREPFEQAETAPSRQHQGTGLGLAIVDRLIRLHGGELVLDSEIGRGTVATLRFGRDRVLPAA